MIGYFIDNELGWWGPALFRYHLQQSRKSFTRRRLVALLREHYQDQFAKFLKDFEMPGVADWEQLESADKPQVWLRPRSNGMTAVSRFLGAVADQYYKVISEAVRRADPNHLLLGDRYSGYYDPTVVQAASRWM